MVGPYCSQAVAIHRRWRTACQVEHWRPPRERPGYVTSLRYDTASQHTVPVTDRYTNKTPPNTFHRPPPKPPKKTALTSRTHPTNHNLHLLPKPKRAAILPSLLLRPPHHLRSQQRPHLPPDDVLACSGLGLARFLFAGLFCRFFLWVGGGVGGGYDEVRIAVR